MGKRLFTLTGGICLILLFMSVMFLGACAPEQPAAPTTGPTTQPTTPPAKPIELSFNTMFPATHAHGMMAQYFSDVIKERTNGRVEITVFWGGSLTTADKVYEGVVKGISDIGGSCPTYTAGRFPIAEMFELPQYVPSAYVSDRVYHDFQKEFQLKEYDDTHVIYLHGPGASVLQSNKRVASPADLKGMIVRTSGTSTSSVIQAWGGSPQAMPMSESTEALSKGVVDANFAYLETLKGYKHGDLVKYVIKIPITCSSIQFVTMNKDKWDALPQDIQKIFTDTGEDFVHYHGMVWDYIDREGLTYFNGLGAGREFIDIPVANKSVWEQPTLPIVEKYIQDKTAMGFPIADYRKYVDERTAYWEKNQPTASEGDAWVKAELLK